MSAKKTWEEEEEEEEEDTAAMDIVVRKKGSPTIYPVVQELLCRGCIAFPLFIVGYAG
jgi:hypothetical protein